MQTNWKESRGRPLGLLGDQSTLLELRLRDLGLFSYEEPKHTFFTTYRVAIGNMKVGTFQRCTVKERKTTVPVHGVNIHRGRGCGNSVHEIFSELNSTKL